MAENQHWRVSALQRRLSPHNLRTCALFSKCESPKSRPLNKNVATSERQFSGAIGGVGARSAFDIVATRLRSRSRISFRSKARVFSTAFFAYLSRSALAEIRARSSAVTDRNMASRPAVCEFTRV